MEKSIEEGKKQIYKMHNKKITRARWHLSKSYKKWMEPTVEL